jgi:probable phosphoglycerate mutase
LNPGKKPRASPPDERATTDAVPPRRGCGIVAAMASDVPGLRTVLLARHGETDWNAAGRWQGQTDVPLNANGRGQALALAERLRGEGVASIASSDLLRARATAEIVARALGLAVDRLAPELREQGFGRFEGLTRAECAARHPEEWARFLADSHHAPPGGESRDALLARVAPAIHRIAGQLPSPVLVIMHGGAMRAFLGAHAVAVANPASEGWRRGGIPNGGVYRLRLLAGEVVDVARVHP